MKVKLKDKETCTQFKDLVRGDVFVVTGCDCCYMKIENCWDLQDTEMNAIILENGCLAIVEDWTPVTLIKGKFVEED